MILRDLIDLPELQSVLANYVLAKRKVVLEEKVHVNLIAIMMCASSEDTMGELRQVRVELSTGDDIPKEPIPNET